MNEPEVLEPLPSPLGALFGLVGAWHGTNTLWVEPGEEGRESLATAGVDTIAAGKMLALSYDWDYRDLGGPIGDPDEPADMPDADVQDGMLLIGVRPPAVREPWLASQETPPSVNEDEFAPNTTATVEVAWCDSWHTDTRIMSLTGEFTSDGGFSALGEYVLPDGIAWGWHIELIVGGPDSFTIEMYNVTPGGSEYLAVRTVYERLEPDDEE